MSKLLPIILGLECFPWEPERNKEENSAIEIVLTNTSSVEFSKKALSIERAKIPDAENDNKYLLLTA